MTIHNFTSKPIQMTFSDTRGYIVCDDGSVWAAGNGEWTQIIKYVPPTKKVKAEKRAEKYSDEFMYFWKLWQDNIKNASAIGDANKAFIKLSKDEKTALVYSVPLYAKTQPIEKHSFLKRAASYINSKMFESMGSFKESTAIEMPSMDNVIWKTEIFNQETGITDSASSQINSFGMPKAQAWALIQEKIA